jgi:hypothetical protein
MTLKEKFSVINCNDCDMPYCEIKCTILKPSELNHIEKIADEFAIGFAYFIAEHTYSHYEYEDEWSNDFGKKNLTTKKLLEMYKNEKGL